VRFGYVEKNELASKLLMEEEEEEEKLIKSQPHARQ
jgi:hypothetical protein